MQVTIAFFCSLKTICNSVVDYYLLKILCNIRGVYSIKKKFDFSYGTPNTGCPTDQIKSESFSNY